jgi:hypothetical protein
VVVERKDRPFGRLGQRGVGRRRSKQPGDCAEALELVALPNHAKSLRQSGGEVGDRRIVRHRSVLSNLNQCFVVIFSSVFGEQYQRCSSGSIFQRLPMALAMKLSLLGTVTKRWPPVFNTVRIRSNGGNRRSFTPVRFEIVARASLIPGKISCLKSMCPEVVGPGSSACEFGIIRHPEHQPELHCNLP